MSKRKSRDLQQAVFILGAAPVIVVVICIVILLVAQRSSEYATERELAWEQVSRLVEKSSEGSGKGGTEIELMRLERLDALKRDYARGLASAAGLLAVGIAVPLIGCRYLSNLLLKNLELLNSRLASTGSTESTLMPHHFDFHEFESLEQTLRNVSLEQGETEQRWERAERELVLANADLVRRANELKKERVSALQMMEEAERARNEEKEANRKLSDVLEQARQSARDAEQANNAKSDFLATMSHEIRTPLNGIIGFVDMLDETELDEDQRDYLDTIKISGRSLMELINDILDFSKIESGSLLLESREFSLVGLIRELASVFFNQAAGKGVDLEFEIDEDVPRIVIGDEMRLKQILMNLLSNALKFTDEGRVQLAVCLCPRGDEDEDGDFEIEFEVSDSGIGVDPENLKDLFMPFTQADSSTTRKFGGTGLGLAISKRITEAMGGQIGVESVPGQGAVFSVQIPLKRGNKLETDSKQTRLPSSEKGPNEERVRSENLAAKPAQSSLRVFIAEDNEANLRVVDLMLRRIGVTAKSAKNGLKLIELLQEVGEADLVLMDLQMPVMDGLEATIAIREGRAGDKLKNLTILALTANAMVGDEERCRESGMNGYLTKPLKIDVLQRELEKHFG